MGFIYNMEIHSNYNISFTARCPQIRDADWVCRTINNTLPHTSSTKLFPVYKKILSKYLKPYASVVPKDTIELSELLDWMILDKTDFKKLTPIGNIMHKLHYFFMPSNKKHLQNLLIAIRKNIHQLGNNREKCMGEIPPVYKCLKMLEVYKQGNCFENAKIAELILKMNGIKNAYTVFLKKNNHYIDHNFCLFNKDNGLNYQAKDNNTFIIDPWNKKTIIIDPWCNKADFIDNMMILYENRMKNHFNIDRKQNLTFEIHDIINLSEKDLGELREKFPQFVYKNSKRKFMDK